MRAPISANLLLIDLNWLSERMMLTLKPWLVYTPMMILKCLIMVLFSMLSSLPTDPNLMCLKIVKRDAIVLTFIASVNRVICLYCGIIATGIV